MTRNRTTDAKKNILDFASKREKEYISPRRHEHKEKNVAAFAALREKENDSKSYHGRKEKRCVLRHSGKGKKSN